MPNTKKMVRIALYAKLTDEELNIVDAIVEKLDYENRTEFITSLIYSVIYGERPGDDIPEIQELTDCISNLEILQKLFFEIIDDYAFPVIAKLGPDKTYQVLHDDLSAWMYNRCHIVPDEDQMRKWLHAYHSAKRNRIIAYKTQLMTDTYKEEHGINEPNKNEENHD